MCAFFDFASLHGVHSGLLGCVRLAFCVSGLRETHKRSWKKVQIERHFSASERKPHSYRNESAEEVKLAGESRRSAQCEDNEASFFSGLSRKKSNSSKKSNLLFLL